MRRDGIIIFILGNHEIWAYDSPIRDLDKIVEMYRAICNKYDVILLQNELAFFTMRELETEIYFHFLNTI